MNPRSSLYPLEHPFWRNHALWPLLAFGLVFGMVEALGLDRRIALAWSFDAATGHWLGTGAGDWWAHRLLHDDGRWLVRGIAALAVAVWGGSFFLDALRPARSRAGYVALSMIAAIAIVGGLKAITNVDCPWDLAGFGGQNPYVALFEHRPDYLPRARCFPGAHAASGFALLCFYFAFRDSAPRRARIGLLGGLSLGGLFAAGQEARGAHFFSHDLTAAAIVWFAQLALYVWLLEPRAVVDREAPPLHGPRACRAESGGR